jgi:hypothetical protein
MQPPEVSMQIEQAPKPLEARNPSGLSHRGGQYYRKFSKGEYGSGPSVPAMLILALAFER